MNRIHSTLVTLATLATVLAGAALLSGWMTVAMAGGGKWSG
jgi:K+ transporter